MPNKEKTFLTVCLLLVALAAGALVDNRRLQSRQRLLEAEVARLQSELASIPAKPLARASLPAPAPKPKPVSQAPVAASPSQDERAELEASWAEIQDLKVQLNDRDSQLAALSRTNRFHNGERMFRGRRGESREAELEALQQADPQRFQEMETQRAAFRERIKTDTRDKHAFLASIDVSQWPADMQENHARIVSLYATVNKAIEPGADGAESNHDARRQLFEQMRETGQLLEAEQDMLLYDTAQQLGFSGADASQFVEHIKTIHTVTTPRGFFPGRGGGRPSSPAPAADAP